jgi:hypothetical protein
MNVTLSGRSGRVNTSIVRGIFLSWQRASLTDRLAINALFYSELSIAFERIEELDAVISEASLTVESIPREALFLAGKVFLNYRRRHGSYFPTVRLIAP